MLIKKGEIFLVDLSPTRGSEQSGHRPVLVVQNDVGNEFSPTTIIVPLTTKNYSKEYPTNVQLQRGTAGLKEDSTVLCSQIRTIDKSRLGKKLGTLPPTYLEKVNLAMKVSLEL